jgi:hypothetical protein
MAGRRSLREAEQLLEIDRVSAWLEYLAATRGQHEARYREIEPWAWAKLQQRLGTITTRLDRLQSR